MAFYIGLATYRLLEKKYRQLVSYQLTVEEDTFRWEMDDKAITIPFSTVTSVWKYDDGKIIINGKDWQHRIIMHSFVEDYAQLEAWLRQRWIITDEIATLTFFQHDWLQIALCTGGLMAAAVKETNGSRVAYMATAVAALLAWALRASDRHDKFYKGKSNFSLLVVMLLVIIALYVANAGFFQTAKTAY